MKQVLCIPTSLGPSPRGASSAVPKEATRSPKVLPNAVVVSMSTEKRPIQLSRPHVELRLRLQAPSSIPVVFASSPSLQGFSFPPALNAYSGHQLARTKATF